MRAESNLGNITSGLVRAGIETPPLRTAYTPSFPALLRQLGVSLLVTTYQDGRLVLIGEDGERLRTHFRPFQFPMGMALDGEHLALGASLQVLEFVNVPAIAAKLEPPGRYDACFLPRSCHFTGNIDIHEMAWGAGCELWIVNTRFSCLCTLDRKASFTPRWLPPFISALEPTERCLLNGLAMVDGRPRYVTALGESDEPGGWRPNKAKGGVLIDVELDAVFVRGLSMPHSPRWHAGRLWLCESGSGTFGAVDPNTQRYEPLAEAPGFTRGLDFAGPYAFVGLSLIRGSALHSGIAITKRLQEHERVCGICAIDLKSGRLVALLRFESAVPEVFAVTVLPGRRSPDLINGDEKLLESCFAISNGSLAKTAATTRFGPTRSGVTDEQQLREPKLD